MTLLHDRYDIMRGDVVIVGADPTATVDSSAAIQAASDYLNTHGGGSLYLPYGHYLVNQVNLSPLVRRFHGPGVIYQMTAATDPIVVTDTEGIEFADLRFVGLGEIFSNTTFVRAIYAIGGTNVVLRNCSATLFNHTGFWIEDVAGVAVRDCHGDSNKYAGLMLRACTGFVVSGGTYNNNGYAGGGGDYGITLQESALGENSAGLIEGVYAIGNFRKGIDVHCGHRVKIVGNHVSAGATLNITASGIYAVNEGGTKLVSDISIIGNTVDGSVADTSQAFYAIEVGCSGGAAGATGTFILDENIITGMDRNAANRAILIDTSTGGAQVERVLIRGNSITNGSGGSSRPAVGFGAPGAGTTKVLYTVITGNMISCETFAPSALIALLWNNYAVIEDNVLIVAATTAYAVAAGVGTQQVTGGNILKGDITNAYQVTPSVARTDLVIP